MRCTRRCVRDADELIDGGGGAVVESDDRITLSYETLVTTCAP